MRNFKENYGPWALITGASSGIGAEFANQLANEGLNLVLVARRKDLLDKKAEELQKEYGIKTMTIELDLTKKDSCETLDSMTKDIDLGLVIPNAGMITDGSFLKIPLEEQEELVNLNIIAPMKMAHIFGNRLAKKKRGGIVMLSSTFAYQAVPYFANYASSKSYILYLSEALHYELADKGVEVLALSPGLTDTQMPKEIAMDFSKMPMKMMKPKCVVKTAIKALKKKKSSVVPGCMNKIMAKMSQRVMPRSAVASIFGSMNKKAMDAKIL